VESFAGSYDTPATSLRKKKTSTAIFRPGTLRAEDCKRKFRKFGAREQMRRIITTRKRVFLTRGTHRKKKDRAEGKNQSERTVGTKRKRRSTVALLTKKVAQFDSSSRCRRQQRPVLGGESRSGGLQTEGKKGQKGRGKLLARKKEKVRH